MKQSAQVKIIQVLKDHPWLSIEEIEKTYRDMYYVPIGVSNNNIGTRLPSMAREGYRIENKRYYTIGRKRDGKAYCEWKIDRVVEIQEHAISVTTIGEQGRLL